MSQPYNPYSAPQASPPTVGSAPEGQPQLWNPSEVVSLAWERFKRYWPVLVLAYLIITFASQVLAQAPIVGSILTHGAAHLVPAPVEQQVVCGLATFALGAFLQVGFVRMCLDGARGRTPKFEALFGGADRLWAMVGLNLLLALVVGLGMVLFVVPGLIVALGCFAAPFYVIEGKMGPVDAMKASWAVTMGHKGNLFGLAMISVGLTLLGVMMCCVGWLATVPLCYLAWAIVYVRLSGIGLARPETAPLG